MKCRETQELLSSYFDGELPSEERALVAQHLASCQACSAKHAVIARLSQFVDDTPVPSPPENLWNEIEEQLADQSVQPRSLTAPHTPFFSTVVFSTVAALAATIVVAVGIGWFAFQNAYTDRGHGQFAAEFEHYLDTLRLDPDAAQQILLAKYNSTRVEPSEAIHMVGYQPAVAAGLPADYTIDATYVIEMPCCTCVQTVCKRSDGSTMTIFEHDDEGTAHWFGGQPDITTQCRGKECGLVGLDDQIAATWKHDTRHITVIGIRDIAEIDKLVSWLGNG